MRVLRKVLVWFLALEAIVFAFVSLLATWSFVRAVLSGGGAAVPLAYKAYAGAILAVVVSLGPFYAVAWWMAWRKRASGRAWGLAASGGNVLMGLARPAMSRLPLEAHAHLSGPPIWGLVAWGLAGLVAFWDGSAWTREVCGSAEREGVREGGGQE